MNDQDFDNLRNDVEETREIAERNHEMLKSIESTMFWRRVFTIIYWVLILGVAIGLFYFLDPYIDRLFDAYSQLVDQFNSIPDIGGGSAGGS